MDSYSTAVRIHCSGLVILSLFSPVCHDPTLYLKLSLFAPPPADLLHLLLLSGHLLTLLLRLHGFNSELTSLLLWYMTTASKNKSVSACPKMCSLNFKSFTKVLFLVQYPDLGEGAEHGVGAEALRPPHAAQLTKARAEGLNIRDNG